jgi:hypothetical protein
MRREVLVDSIRLSAPEERKQQAFEATGTADGSGGGVEVSSWAATVARGRNIELGGESYAAG